MESQRTPSPSFAASAAARRSRRDGDDYSVHGSVASIPVEAVAPPTTFVEDMGHRSLAMGESSASSRAGGVALFSSAAAVTTPAFTLKATDDLLLAPPKQLFTGKCGTASGSSCAPCPRALPLMPSFLEPNNHAFIRGTIAVAIVIEIVRDLLARNHVDSHFDAEKCRWKASRTTLNTAVDFRITVYRCPKEQWCVEFQKRKGDLFVMREVFEQFLQEAERRKILVDVCPLMARGGLHEEDKGSVPPPPMSAMSPFDLGPGVYLPPPPPPLGMEEEADVLGAPPSSHHFKPFIAMAEAGCPLIRFEAAKAIAQLSSSEDNRSMLKEAGAIPVLVKLLCETQDDCSAAMQARQAAVMAISNLSASPACKGCIVDSGAALGLLELVSNPGDEPDFYLQLEMRREGARALANLCEEQEHASKVVSAAGKDVVSDWLKSVDTLSDERMHMYACRIRRMVRSCC